MAHIDRRSLPFSTISEPAAEHDRDGIELLRPAWRGRITA
jgi:hypothetical protein